MAGLRESLRAMSGSPLLPPPLEPIRTREIRASFERTLGALPLRPPDPDLLRSTYRVLSDIASGGGSLAGVSLAHLRRAPWVLFEPLREGSPPLADNLEFLQAYLREIMRRASGSIVAALLTAFFVFYPARTRGFEPLRRLLANTLVPQMPGSRGARWRTCVADFGLLEPDGPLRLASRLASSADNPAALLAGNCLNGSAAEGAFVVQAFAEWTSLIRTDLGRGRCTEDRLGRYLGFARSPLNSDRLRYERARTSVAEGLLLPFAEGSPGPHHQEAIREFLLATLGDPRLTGAARWAGVDPRARQVMLAWLVRTTLEDFFRLLEYVANHGNDATARRHWRTRKAFWTRYLNAGLIQDAWVVMKPNVRAEARQFLSSQSGEYGSLWSGGLPNHSAIVMRIGGLTITEWSHSGKFRVWNPGHPSPPLLHQPSYHRLDLVRGANHEDSHNGAWQRRFQDAIYEQTRLSP